MPSFDKVSRRQIQMGMADWFRPYAESAPPFNQIKVDAGVFFNAGTKMPYLMGIQTSTPSFAVVALGQYRYDLVYLDEIGVPRATPGTPQVLPVTPYNGAPGQAGGPALPANAFPIAYVLVEETATVVVVEADITDIRGIMWHPQLALAAELLADGVASVGANMKRIGVDHVHPLNVDATLPQDTSRTGPALPGAVGKYSDIGHVHKVDPTLVSDVNALLSGAIALRSRSNTLIFMPDDTAPGTQYKLHAFQGHMVHKTTGDHSQWANIKPGAALAVNFSAAPGWVGPGKSDGDASSAAFADRFYYVYLLCNPTVPTFALVYSGRAPDQGPLLTDPSFTNYPLYRFIGTVCNQVLGSWDLVPLRKIDNHVEYELAQRTFTHGIFGDSGWLSASLADRVPSTSMRAFVRAFVEGKNATQELYLAPPDAGTATPGSAMNLHSARPPGYKSREEKIHATAFTITAGLQYWGTASGFVDLNDLREIGFRHLAGGLSHDAHIDVLGYEEYTDWENVNDFTW